MLSFFLLDFDFDLDFDVRGAMSSGSDVDGLKRVDEGLRSTELGLSTEVLGELTKEDDGVL